MSNRKYYAVKVGFLPGVYPTWDEAKRQVQGYRYCKHKGFDDLAAAEAFAGAPLVIDRFASPFLVLHDGTVVKRFDLTSDVRTALKAAGVNLDAQ